MVHRAPRRFRRVVAAAGAGVLASGLLAACGSSESSSAPVINLYGGTSQTGFDKIIESYGEDVSNAWDDLSEVDPASDDGKAAAAAFEAMEAKCP